MPEFKIITNTTADLPLDYISRILLRKISRRIGMGFGGKLKVMRKQAGMSQERLAEKLGVSRHEPAIIRLNQEKPTKSRVCTDLVLFI